MSTDEARMRWQGRRPRPRQSPPRLAARVGRRGRLPHCLPAFVLLVAWKGKAEATASLRPRRGPTGEGEAAVWQVSLR